MNQLNQIISALRVQIEAEKKQSNPNWDKINSLQNELQSCLDRDRWLK